MRKSRSIKCVEREAEYAAVDAAVSWLNNPLARPRDVDQALNRISDGLFVRQRSDEWNVANERYQRALDEIRDIVERHLTGKLSPPNRTWKPLVLRVFKNGKAVEQRVATVTIELLPLWIRSILTRKKSTYLVRRCPICNAYFWAARTRKQPPKFCSLECAKVRRKMTRNSPSGVTRSRRRSAKRQSAVRAANNVGGLLQSWRLTSK